MADDNEANTANSEGNRSTDPAVHRHHEAPDTMPKGRVYAFVTDSIESALEQERAAAGDKDIAVMGGPDIRRQFVEAGLVDEKCRHAGPTTS